MYTLDQCVDILRLMRHDERKRDICADSVISAIFINTQLQSHSHWLAHSFTWALIFFFAFVNWVWMRLKFSDAQCQNAHSAIRSIHFIDSTIRFDFFPWWTRRILSRAQISVYFDWQCAKIRWKNEGSKLESFNIRSVHYWWDVGDICQRLSTNFAIGNQYKLPKSLQYWYNHKIRSVLHSMDARASMARCLSRSCAHRSD